MYQRLFAASTLCIGLMTTVGCAHRAQQNTSEPATAREATHDMTDTGPLNAFIALTQGIQASSNHSGAISVSKFLSLIPLSEDDHQSLSSAFPNDFAVTCAGSRCSATAAGTESTATLLASVRLSFFVTITNPELAVDSQVSTDFVLRGDQGIEFCNVSGFTVSKLGITQAVRGMYERVEGDELKLTVADDDDFTCD